MLLRRPAGQPPDPASRPAAGLVLILGPVLGPALLLSAGLVLGCGDPLPPRVVLITAPSLPAGDPAALLGERAGGAVRFASFYAAAPWTEPSLASMLTGRQPWDHGVLRPGDPLPPGVATVAGALSGRFPAEPSSAAVVDRRSGIGPGFTRDFDLVARTDDPIAAALGLLDRLGHPEGDDRAGAGRTGQLLWIHLGDEVAEIARLLDRLDADSGSFESHVVIAAARGDPVRAPLLLLSPRLEPGVRRDVAGSVDVARTLLSLARVEYPPAPWSNARDLSAWAPDPTLDAGAASGVRAAAFGMLPERDGRPLFYACDRAGRLYAGNASGLLVVPDGARRHALEELADLFRALESRVAPRPAPKPTSIPGSPPAPSPPAPPPPPAGAPAPP